MALGSGQDDAADMCRRTAECAGLMPEAARAGRTGAQAAADGEDASTTDEHVETPPQRPEAPK